MKHRSAHDSIRQTRHATVRTRRCTHRWGRPRHQRELRQAVRGERHACRHRSEESGQIGPDRTWRRRTACADTRAMQANRRPWSCCSRMSCETLGLLPWSCTTSTAGWPAFFARGSPKPTQAMALDTLRNSAFSAFLVGQQAARLMRENEPDANGTKGTIIFTNASAALKGFPLSAAFAMACQAKSGLAQSMARELMPQGIHIANVPIDAAIGWTQEDGTRAHRLAGTTRRRQHGRPGLHRGNVSAAASAASVDVGVRSRAATVGREMVTHVRSALALRGNVAAEGRDGFRHRRTDGPAPLRR